MDIKTILLAMVLMLFSFGGAASAGGELNLNHASAAELQTLKGIGASTAAAIVRYREAHGAFKSVDELLQVKGIGHKKLEALKGHLEVGDSKQDD